jgi:MoaA/NifB/PqqE/SkfB family radical SAM enzyme
LGKLEDIGFYTLSDKRAATSSHTSPLARCELVLTSRCNFRCPYCRNVGGEDISYDNAASIVKYWASWELKNIRFSGGEPTLYPHIFELCPLAKKEGIERIAISTNGSAKQKVYEQLLSEGVNDFSVSLDACCADDSDKMTGGAKEAFDIVTKNIQWLSSRTYTTVGVVLTKDNEQKINDIIQLASQLGVSDIRIIPAAQNTSHLRGIIINPRFIDNFPILAYRIKNIRKGRSVRGLRKTDSKYCSLVLDDIAVNQNKHYPCIIYMRESGKAIGSMGFNTRNERRKWYESHNTHEDPICKKNCLDVCIDYNNRVRKLQNKCI